MGDQLPQRSQKIGRHTLDGFDTVTVFAERPAELQLAIDNQAVDLQRMAAALLRTVPRAGGFGRETEQARSGQNLIELTKVVEQNLGFRLARQIRVSAQISQDAIANSATRDLAKLFLDGLERFARSPLLSAGGQFQARRED